MFAGALLSISFALTAPQVTSDSEEVNLAGEMPRLLEVIKSGLRRTEPSVNVVRHKAGESLFDGSYDWHSNLFGHWALLTHARTHEDKELAAWVLEPLTADAIAAERVRLEKVETDTLTTFPYDQSWLLQLLTELEKHREVAPATRAFRLEVETRLIDWLEQSKFPENDHPDRLDGRGIVGWYRSWAFTWYQVRRSEPIGEKASERLAQLRTERIVPQRKALLEPQEPFPFEFLWVPTLAWLIDDVAPFEEKLPPYELGELPALPESVKLSTTHKLGVHVSRLWPLAIAARTDEAARTRLDAEFATFIAREDLWAGDFTVVSHWMPQFLWFTGWLADGCP